MEPEQYKNIKDSFNELYRSQESKIDISVWVTIDDREEQVISMYNVYSNPFKLGDEIYITVEELYPIDLKAYRESIIESFKKANEEKTEMFNRKKIKLISEEKYLTTKILKRDRLRIEYFAEFVEK